MSVLLSHYATNNPSNNIKIFKPYFDCLIAGTLQISNHNVNI